VNVADSLLDRAAGAQWRFYMPLAKGEPESDHGEPLWTVQGIAASEHRDRQKERLFMKGMDFQPYLDSGVINWNHQDRPGAIIGAPMEGRIVDHQGVPAFFTKGFLYKEKPMAQELWQHLEMLDKGTYPVKRGIGWSVQGAITERSGSDLVKSVVLHCAVTHEPVNAITWAGLVKSLLGEVSSPPAFGQPTSTFAPLVVQDMAGGYPSHWLTEHCATHSHARGGWKNGLHGLLDHLVECRGVPARDARHLVTTLATQR
jgi:hypothetical protein